MKQDKVAELKTKLIELLKEYDIDKFEIIYDLPDSTYGIRNGYTDAESVYNMQARCQMIIANNISGII